MMLVLLCSLAGAASAQNLSKDSAETLKVGIEQFKNVVIYKATGAGTFDSFTKAIEVGKGLYRAGQPKRNALKFLEIWMEYVDPKGGTTDRGQTVVNDLHKLFGGDPSVLKHVEAAALDMLHKKLGNRTERRQLHKLLIRTYNQIKHSGNKTTRTPNKSKSGKPVDLSGLWINEVGGKGREWYYRISQDGDIITATIEDAGSFLKSYGGGKEAACQIGQEGFTGKVTGKKVKVTKNFAVQMACLPPRTAALYKGMDPNVEYTVSDDLTTLLSPVGAKYNLNRVEPLGVDLN